MRTVVMLTFLLIAGPSYAEDPLETLNTVEDTLSTMERTLSAQAPEQGEGAAGRSPGEPGARQGKLEKELYFVSDESLDGARGWVKVRPCPGKTGSLRTAPDSESCADVAGEAGGYFWESRAALAADLKPGVVVIAHHGKEGAPWIMTRITDVSELGSGYVTVSAPFKVPVKGLRVVEE